MSTKKSLRCLFYVQDGYGMGHISRVANLSGHLKQTFPEWDIIVVTGDKNASNLLRQDVEFIKLPSFKITSDQEGRMINSTAALSSYALTSTIRRNIVDKILTTFKPSVIVIEHMPRGHGRELSGLLRAHKHKHPDCHLILGIRGILGSKKYAYSTVFSPLDLEYIHDNYDSVLAFTDNKVIDVVTYYDLPDWFKTRLHYTGYVMAPNNNAPTIPVDLRTIGVEPGEAYLGVGLGSGVSAEALLSNVLVALKNTSGLPAKKIIVSGPKLSIDAHSDFVNKYPEFIFHKNITNYSEFIENASCFIGFAGYNTVSACLKNYTPALFISREQSLLGEQQQHIEVLSKLGICTGIHENDASVNTIIDKLSVFKNNSIGKHTLAINGGSMTSIYINNLQKKQLTEQGITSQNVNNQELVN